MSIGLLTDTTYSVDGTNYKQDNLSQDFETPFNDQSTYCQRSANKNFKISAKPYDSKGWYEHRPVNNVDFATEMKEYGSDQVKDFPYNKTSQQESFTVNMPKSAKNRRVNKHPNGSKESYITHPYPGAEDTWSSGMIHDSIESFKIANHDVPIIKILVVIALIVIFFMVLLYANGPFKDIRKYIAQNCQPAQKIFDKLCSKYYI